MPLDFYVWVIRDGARVVLVDTGFSAETAALRGRTLDRSPVDALADLGIAPETVSDVVVTHLHYDHAGNLDRFPAARVHLQEEELRYCTGRAMRHDRIRRPYRDEDVCAAVRCLFDGRLVLHRDTAEILPGLELHRVGGHTPGSQVVRVGTARGQVVLASDASHYYANLINRNPFPILDDLTAVLDGYDVIESLADGPDHIVPGHDPAVARGFPRLPSAPEWICLHEPVTAAAAVLAGAPS